MGSGSNVELVRSVYAAFNGGRMPLELLDPEVELDLTERIFNPATYSGHEGALQFWHELQEVWESWASEPTQLFDGGELVVALIRSRGRGRSSGVEVEDESANVWTVRDGKVVSYRLYREQDAALAAAGLERSA
jgi:uncharacterized protein